MRLSPESQWSAANPVDVHALQELKLSDNKFPFMEFETGGYHSVVFGQKTATPTTPRACARPSTTPPRSATTSQTAGQRWSE
ncbi:MAG: hypothetical protein ABI292_07980 [Rhodoferax sp.]